jgi:AcrR family transcriptional regulator
MTTAPFEPKPPRQARSRATRARLVEATVAALVELGYSGTTTTEVAQRAGVSQGALYKHFPSKVWLLTAGVEWVYAQLVAEFRAAFAAQSPAGAAAPEIALRLLASSFSEPRLLAAFEVYTAARTDERLRDALAPILDRHRASLHREAQRLFPSSPAEVLEPLVDIVMSTLQGAALGGLVAVDGASERRGLGLLERWVRQELARV